MKTLLTMPLSAQFGGIVIVLYVLTALFAPVIAPYDQGELAGPAFAPWGGDFWLGTDNLGRDIFSRLVYGARNTIGIAFLTTLLSFSFGGMLGLIAATFGKWVDEVLSRLVDVFMAIPSLIFALLLLAIFGTGTINLILIIAFLDSTRVFRLARALGSIIMVMDYVEAARVRGENLFWIIRREILPNILPPLISEFGLRFCFVFLMIAALSFLGLGLQPPTVDWGSMVRESSSFISFGSIEPLIPAAAIALLTVAVNFIIDWLLHRTSGLKE